MNEISGSKHIGCYSDSPFINEEAENWHWQLVCFNIRMHKFDSITVTAWYSVHICGDDWVRHHWRGSDQGFAFMTSAPSNCIIIASANTLDFIWHKIYRRSGTIFQSEIIRYKTAFPMKLITETYVRNMRDRTPQKSRVYTDDLQEGVEGQNILLILAPMCFCGTTSGQLVFI